jgi:hypothetical protein
MPSYSKNDVILVRYPFSDLSVSKVRPAVVVNAPHVSIVNSEYAGGHSGRLQSILEVAQRIE